MTHGFNVGSHIIIGQHDALGIPRGTGRKDDGHHIVGLHTLEAQSATQHAQRNKPSRQQGFDFRQFADLLTEIFQIDQLGIQIHRPLFHKPTAGKYLLNAGFFDAVVHDIF